MHRRFKFLDCMPGYNYNEGRVWYYDQNSGRGHTLDRTKLGSTLTEAMLDEATNICVSNATSWSDQSHMQVGNGKLLYCIYMYSKDLYYSCF